MNQELVMNQELDRRLIWLDLEMTGLDPHNDSILEIATVVTDANLNELAVGPVLAIRHPESTLRRMDEWNTSHHTASGLWRRVLDSTVSLHDAERQTVDVLARWTSRGASPLCGNSVCQDRRSYPPDARTGAVVHYRNLDVSTLKELAARWAPAVLDALHKESRHEALADIRESIAELRHYRAFMGVLGGQSGG
jgi:oligoribonuclease